MTTEPNAETTEQPNKSSSDQSIWRRVWSYCFTLGQHLLIFFLVFTVLLQAAPPFLDFFDDNEVDLPPSTMLVWTISRSWANYSLYYVIIGLGLDASLLAILTFALPPRLQLSSFYAQGCLWMTILMLVFVILSLSLPFR